MVLMVTRSSRDVKAFGGALRLPATLIPSLRESVYHERKQMVDNRMSTKQRLSATVDAATMVAAQAAVRDGRAANISAWVNEALHRQAEHDQRMKALDDFLLAYEDEYGVITDDEIRSASRRLHSRAVVVRGKARAARATKRQRRVQGAR